MADYYEINPFKRAVSMVIAPIDGYTGRLLASKDLNAIIEGIGRRAMVKNDGYCVFTDVPNGIWEIVITSSEYFRQTVSIDTRGQGTYVPVIKTRLIPNSFYRLPGGAAFIDCPSEKGLKIYTAPFGKDPFAKLRSFTENSISIKTAGNEDLSNQLLAFCEEGKMEIFETGEKTGNNSYSLIEGFKSQYKAGAVIYPVSQGLADDKGRLFCPVRGVYEEHREIIIRIEGAGMVCNKRLHINGGKGGSLILGRIISEGYVESV